MLTFVCPHCGKELKINEEHVGLRGRCNKCNGRIALIGRTNTQRPQMASRIAEEAEGAGPPATPRQVETARRLGAQPEQVAAMDRETAGEVIAAARDARAEQEPPTARQLDYLKALGLPAAALEAIKSKAEASRTIAQWLPPPTKSQLEYLARLGANPALVARLKTKSDAAALIQQLLSTLA